MLHNHAFRVLAIAGLSLVLTHCESGVGAAEPTRTVAIVSDAVGEAFVVAPTRRGDVPIAVLSELSAGELLRLEPGCQVVISFTGSGKVFELAGGGRFLIGENTIEALDRSGRLRTLVQDLAVRMLS